MASPVVPKHGVDHVLLEEKAPLERQFSLPFAFVLYQGGSFNTVTARVRGGRLWRAFGTMLFPLVCTGVSSSARLLPGHVL